MGAWGTGSFENDDASDWVYALEDEGVGSIRDALEVITTAQPEDYLEVFDCSVAIAAAEVVAAMMGQPAKDLPEEVTGWLRTKPRVPPDLASLAREAVTRIANESELKDVWDEALPEDAAAWASGVKELLQRLS
ncbi:MAG: DUF4259 domain-containing protein [Phycisphaeraceae bacterium]|jgi:hypothetical protein|nr:DUF4259 domain-containing protein [Phycisphaeraceae bacterium]